MEYFVTYFFMGYPNCKHPDEQEKQQDKDCSKCKDWTPVSREYQSCAGGNLPLLCRHKPGLAAYCRCSVEELTTDQKKVFEDITKIQRIPPDYETKGFPGFVLQSSEELGLPAPSTTTRSAPELEAVRNNIKLKDKFDDELKNISADELKDISDGDILSSRVRKRPF